MREALGRWLQQEDLNFALTNRIPRRLLTRLVGGICRIEQPLVRDASIALFRFFAGDLALHEAKLSSFRSLHDCFVRELKEGARPVDPDPSVVTSPCDAVVGACGRMEGMTVIQAKGRTYSVEELVGESAAARSLSGGVFVTLRLRANMYHRFHAPCDCRVERVRYVPGDVWNVNSAAVRRVERLFCRNERAVLWTRREPGGTPLVLVPVAAILVAGIRLRFFEGPLRARGGAAIPCDARFGKGDEMGWFEHGSTIIVLGPPELRLHSSITEGMELRMGQPLLRLGEPGAQDATAGRVSAAGGSSATR